MGNKYKINQNGKRYFWNYAGVVAAFMVLGVLGIQFMNQSETKELPADNYQKTVFKEELKQEELPVVENKETVVSSLSNKKKTVKPKKKNSNEYFLAETTVVEDTISDKTIPKSVVSERYNWNMICGCCGPRIPSLNISMGTDKYPEKNRKPEVILKDVEALTRNGNYTYIVDGVRVSEETFRLLNQNDIESIDVYKHSDITQALYGNKDNQSRIALRVE